MCTWSTHCGRALPTVRRLWSRSAERSRLRITNRAHDAFPLLSTTSFILCVRCNPCLQILMISFQLLLKTWFYVYDWSRMQSTCQARSTPLNPGPELWTTNALHHAISASYYCFFLQYCKFGVSSDAASIHVCWRCTGQCFLSAHVPVHKFT